MLTSLIRSRLSKPSRAIIELPSTTAQPGLAGNAATAAVSAVSGSRSDPPPARCCQTPHRQPGLLPCLTIFAESWPCRVMLDGEVGMLHLMFW